MASRRTSKLDRAAALRRRELLLDAAVAAIVFALSFALLAARDTGADTRGLDLLGVLLAALASLPLVARRRAPLAVFALTAAASATLNGLGYPPGPPLGPTVALYFLALSPEKTRASRWLTGGLVAGFYVIHAGAGGVAEDEFPTVPLLFGALVWGGAWVIGDRVRQRRARIGELEEKLRRAAHEAERERRLAAAEERTRIARDLHDSAGHAMNVIVVRAGVARMRHDEDPERSRAALEAIEEVARQTVAEIDQIVGTLRDRAEHGETAGPPGLASLQTLVAHHSAAGLDVTVATAGLPRPLGAAVDAAAYRILQEALTNAARHGAGAARVELAFGDAALELTITNPVPNGGPRPTNGGHGLIGMRERASLLGGSLDTDQANGTFRLRADLPYGGQLS